MTDTMSADLHVLMAPDVISMQHARFDKALARLNELDDHASVALDTETGVAVCIDGMFGMEMPTAARALPNSDRAAAAAVLFLDQFGALFGIAGWHVLHPVSASPIGSSIWFVFDADTAYGRKRVHICTDEQMVISVRLYDE